MTLREELKLAVEEWRRATGAAEKKLAYAVCVELAMLIFAGYERKKWYK